MKTRYQTYLDDYQAYHKDPRNKATHYLGIPMIVFSIVGLLQRVDLFQIGGFQLDLAIAVLIPLGIFYIALNLFSGVGMVLVLLGMYALAPHVGYWPTWALFIGGWILQAIGHYYEGKQPAFFKNGLHLLVGPLWILNDLFFKLKLPAYNQASSV